MSICVRSRPSDDRSHYLFVDNGNNVATKLSESRWAYRAPATEGGRGGVFHFPISILGHHYKDKVSSKLPNFT